MTVAYLVFLLAVFVVGFTSSALVKPKLESCALFDLAVVMGVVLALSLLGEQVGIDTANISGFYEASRVVLVLAAFVGGDYIGLSFRWQIRLKNARSF